MSTNKAPAASASAPTSEAPFITFPPFPEVPAESGLVPFKDFKPSGIQISVSGDDDIEIDGLGIPTVELRVKHDTDEPKTGKKKKKKSKSAKNSGLDGEPVKRLTWWEDWEEGEDLRVSSTGYSSAFSRVDRLFKASRDFTEGRKWPGIQTGVRAFWDQYRIYVGLLVTATVYRKPLSNAISNKRRHDEAGDDVPDDNEDPKITVGTDDPDQNAAPKKHQRPRPNYNDTDVGATDDDDDDDEEEEDEATIAKKRADAEEFREEKLIAFLNDPEKSTMIFLSSYMREQGMIWADRNLVTGPRLTAFFINFLLRNRALPESNHERGLRCALEVTAVALKELPLTAKIGQAMPDTISIGLKDCFGRMTGGSFQMDGSAILEGWAKCADKGDGEREKKRLKVDEETSAGASAEENHQNRDGKEVADETVDEFEAELKAANVEVIHTDSLSGDDDIMKQIVDDNVGMDVEVDVGNSAGWGSSDNAWGADNGEWGQASGAGGGNVLDIPAATGNADIPGWGSNSATPDPWADTWSAPKVCLLMKLLGPTVLPLTHTTGIVEQSTRRIKSVIRPPAIPAKSVAGEGEGGDPEGVEEELEKRFAKVVLEPWIGDDDSDIRKPIIRSTSKGQVYPGSKMEDGTVVEGDIPSPEAKVHNPLQSDITLLVEPSSVDLMSVGMGILATWIQIVRQEKKQSSSGGSSGGKSKKKKKGKSKIPKGYWYMEELLVTFPSFYAEEKLVQTA